MAFETREVEVITCDACGQEEYLCGEMPVGWYNGQAIHHHTGGGSGGDWHACKPAHIKAAVLAAVERND